MTAEQREELLKRVTRDNINEKLSYKECEKIARDLNLTLEQVIHSVSFVIPVKYGTCTFFKL